MSDSPRPRTQERAWHWVSWLFVLISGNALLLLVSGQVLASTTDALEFWNEVPGPAKSATPNLPRDIQPPGDLIPPRSVTAPRVARPPRNAKPTATSPVNTTSPATKLKPVRDRRVKWEEKVLVAPLTAPRCDDVYVYVVSNFGPGEPAFASVAEGTRGRGRTLLVGASVGGQVIIDIGYNALRQSPAVWLAGDDGAVCQALLFDRNPTRKEVWKPRKVKKKKKRRRRRAKRARRRTH